MGFDFVKSVWVNGQEKEEQQQKFYEFVNQMNTYYAGGELPSMASPDIKYSLKMQEKRLKEHGVAVTHKFTRIENAESDRDRFSSLRFNTDRYHSYYNNHIIRHEIEYTKNGSVIGKLKDKRSRLYQSSVYRNEGQEITEKDTFCCPGCGAISPIRTLMDGCPYCGARFTMSTLFPVITSYSYNGRKNASTKGMLKLMKLFTLIGGIGTLAAMLIFQIGNGVNIFVAIATAIIGGLMGAFGGYVVAAFGVFGFFMIKSGIALPVLMETMGTKKKLTAAMKSVDPYFSYEQFFGASHELLRTVLLAEQPEELSFYEGGKVPDYFANVLDSGSVGEMSLVSARRENGYICLDVNHYMNDTELEGNKAKLKTRKYTVGYRRKEGRKTDYGFSIHKVECRQCGGSFDATIEKRCTYCGADYTPDDDNWVIYKIQKIKEIPYLAYMS